MPHSFFDVVELAGRFPKANIVEQLMRDRAVDGEGRHWDEKTDESAEAGIQPERGSESTLWPDQESAATLGPGAYLSWG